jgi:hypothetical protein
VKIRTRPAPFDWLAFATLDEAAHFDIYLYAVTLCIAAGDDVSAYVYARMSARYAIRQLGFSAFPVESAS